jgi:hypothetical protein
MDIEKPPIIEDPALALWLEKLWKGLLEEDIRTSATWNPGSIHFRWMWQIWF